MSISPEQMKTQITKYIQGLDLRKISINWGKNYTKLIHLYTYMVKILNIAARPIHKKKIKDICSPVEQHDKLV
jgi:hypothetical protein